MRHILDVLALCTAYAAPIQASRDPLLVVRPTTTIAIFGEDRLISQALALLLEGVGYDARILDTPSASLDGVEVVLLMPSLSDERKGKLREPIMDDSAKAPVPILNVSHVQEGGLGNQTGWVPWPCSMQTLTEAIEAVLVPAAPSVKG